MSSRPNPAERGRHEDAAVDIAPVREYFRRLQTHLADSLGAAEGQDFMAEDWQSALGCGCGMILEDGGLFERAGVNFSEIRGARLPAAASVRRPQLVGQAYQAAGVSLVAHPRNPHCPTAHLNVRVFTAGTIWWFGGGMDLTPYYGYEEDCHHFHSVCKRALDACDETLYPIFKKQCDDYFMIRHRGERRGVGGIFFDDFNDRLFAEAFAVVRAVGDAFVSAYLPIVQKRRALPYGERERIWQEYRRGRYVEFNLVYDRGTLFGLQSGGRAEAILMSLPPVARWQRGKPPMGEAEARLATDFLPPREWV